MKNLYLALTVFSLSSTIVFGQFHTSEPLTNGEGSKYEFTKIAHLDATPVQSQGYTGTCWSFSALSFFESEMIRMGTENPPLLSEMYVARKAYEGKAEKYIRMDGKIQFSQGGTFPDISYVMKTFGIVPEEIYDGLSYGMETHNHSELFAVLDGAVQGMLGHSKSTSRPLTNAWKEAFNGILDAYLGEDITEFEFEGKKYTPKSYAKKTGLVMEDYISLTSFSNHDWYKPCILAIPDNWSWGTSHNIKLDELMSAAEYALKHGYTVAWDADVSEGGFSFGNGLAINPVDLSTLEVSGSDSPYFSDGGANKKSNAFLSPVEEVEVTQELRQEGYDNKKTQDDHLMHIVGVYKDQEGTKYFLVKNSWGTSNYPEGYLYVSESYFKMKTISVYMHKDGVAKSMLKKLNL